MTQKSENLESGTLISKNGVSDTVRVDLGQRAYDIIIGDDLLNRAGLYIRPLLSRPIVAVVTDQTVYDLHGHALEAGLGRADIAVHWIIRPPGEDQKSFPVLQTVLDGLFNLSFDRHDTVIAFGGGVIGDLTGFAASIYKRGCRFIQIPTTLLAQVDSSVGGKTAINVAQGKNLIGAFYQPQLVLSDMAVLSTLPARDLKAGYGEVLKYGLLGDRDFFDWLESHGAAVLAGDRAAQCRAIRVSCETKARIVAEDEYEHGQRALLNLGHTFGHALESAAGYSGDLLHGEAVSAGMVMAFEFSASLELCTPGDAARVTDHIRAVGLTHPSDCLSLFSNPQALLSTMDQDKKNEAGDLTLILARRIGDAFVQKQAPRDAVLQYLQSYALKAAHA